MNLEAPAKLPLLADKHYRTPSAFTPENLLREARRQKGLGTATVPAVCVLDPDGDMLRQAKRAGRAAIDADWACYHTELYRVSEAGMELGMIGCAVGAPFAVLIAEQLFACGCGLLISMTSAGQLVELRPPPYFILIDRALRDEGTSHHYVAPARFSHADQALLELLIAALADRGVAVQRGATWTTDAPFRETAEAIAARRNEGLLAVEMEAAALYAFAAVRHKPVVCFAHVTNRMARIEGDFEKGEAHGAIDALGVVSTAAKAWLKAQGSHAVRT